MRYLTIALGLAVAAVAANAQQPVAGHGRAMHDAAATPMKTPCPLHLTTLNLTRAQDSAFKAIRAAHLAEMKPIHAAMGMPAMQHQPGMKHDSATHAQHQAMMKQHVVKPEVMKAAHDSMQASMTRAIVAARAVLTPAQRTRFDAAVKAHEAEMAARKAKGLSPCAGCCEHAKHD
jgi:hypothetical protein